MMKVGYSLHMRNGPTCKDKWGIVNNDFKWIFGYMARKKHNEEYSTMNVEDRMRLHLPHQFGRHNMLRKLLNSKIDLPTFTCQISEKGFGY
jgi:hypothetical protein